MHVKRVVHKSVQDFIALIAAQSGISMEQASVTFRSIIQYMQQHPTHPLQRAIDAIFGSRSKDDHPRLN